MNHKITIVTVVYNSERLIARTLENIVDLKKIYKNLDFVVIDGKSYDSTLKIIKKYKKYIDHYISEPDTGIYNAMNKGWKLASGHILFLGAGDIIHRFPEILKEKQIPDIIMGDVNYGNQYIFKSVINYKTNFTNTIHHQALLINKKLHELPPFNEDYKIYADYDFNLMLLKKGFNFYHDKNFFSEVDTSGVSSRQSFSYSHVLENAKIVFRRNGIFWSVVAYFSYLRHYLFFKLFG